jgi:N-acyl-D-aspartate/D-glutamate deacylase
MPYDLIVKNGWIVDGAGMPRYWGDVAAKDGVIVETGRVNGPAARLLDAGGRVIAPGFIDMHTHFDAQITWDPLATSSCWQGVTSVVFGNCGFAVAPCKPDDREFLMQMLTRVEGMDLDVLRAGIDWRWETYPEYLDALEGRLGVNAGALIGHSAVRHYVMGAEANERAATEDEVAQMKAIVREGLLAGGLGFSTSRQVTHFDLAGRPVPSRLAGEEELLTLAGALGELNVGSIEVVPGTTTGKVPGIAPELRRLMVGMARESGRPLNWNTLFQAAAFPGLWRDLLSWTESASTEERVQFWVLNTCYRQDSWFNLGTEGDRPFRGLTVWQEALDPPPAERAARLREPVVRERLRAEMAAPNSYTDFGRISVAEVVRPEHAPWVGRSVAELAAAAGKDPLDFLLDLALAEDLRTVFRMAGANNGDDAAVAEILRSPYSIPGTSDAGAHMDMLCGYAVPAVLLGKWVRERGTLTLEEAVRRITSLPAAVAGIPDRGLIREGMAADLTIFDPDAIRALEPRGARDLPAGGWRLVQGCEGVHATVVNGEVLIEEGKHTGALPGRVLRNRLAH